MATSQRTHVGCLVMMTLLYHIVKLSERCTILQLTIYLLRQKKLTNVCPHSAPDTPEHCVWNSVRVHSLGLEEVQHIQLVRLVIESAEQTGAGGCVKASSSLPEGMHGPLVEQGKV